MQRPRGICRADPTPFFSPGTNSTGYETRQTRARTPAGKGAEPFFPARPSRADTFTESVIREMTRLALQHNAINLAQGFPDFPCPAELKDAACNAVNEDYNQYAITWGAKDLREALAKRVKQSNGMDFDPETEITVTCGSTEAMMASMLAVIQPGDEVIVPEPFYENYGPDTLISGAVPRYVRLRTTSLSTRRHGKPHSRRRAGPLSSTLPTTRPARSFQKRNSGSSPTSASITT